MTATRRVGTATSKTRHILLDLTEQLILDEGYAAVTSRRVAALAGVRPSLVHYYFPGLDDLFIAVYRRRTTESLDRHRQALRVPHPLRVIWVHSMNPAGVALTKEFIALANHRKAMHAASTEAHDNLTRVQLDAVRTAWERYSIDPDDFPPEVALELLTSAPAPSGSRSPWGIAGAHTATIASVERHLDRLERRGGARVGRVPSVQ